jgi:hypothetical protein
MCESVSNRDNRVSCDDDGRLRISRGKCEGHCVVGREKNNRRLSVASHLSRLDRVSENAHGNCMAVIEAQNIVWYDG